MPADARSRPRAATGKFEAEGWRVRKDGSRFWAIVVIDPIHDDDGELIGFAKITRDMTEQREAQQALLESERRFRLLVQGVTDYAIYMLDPEGPRHQLERRAPSGSRATRPTRSSASISRASTPTRTAPPACPSRRSRPRARRPLRGRRLARAQGRHAASGPAW